MNPITVLRDALQQLPARARTALYSCTVAVGAVVALCHMFDVTAIGPVEVAQVEQVLIVLGPVLGVTAVANVSRAAAGRKKAAPFVTRLRCPMCPTTLTVPFTTAESWGDIDASDLATARITITDGGVSRQHMQEHMEADPEAWRKALEDQYRGERQRAESYFAHRA